MTSCPVAHAENIKSVGGAMSTPSAPMKEQKEVLVCPATGTTTYESTTSADISAINPDNLIPVEVTELHKDSLGSTSNDNPLSTHRQVSTIPNAKGEYWVYPSQQQFYTALARKNHHPFMQDMSTVVPIHNAVNEKVWEEILAWERVTCSQCPSPRLVKFEGKPQQFSPKARFFNLLGFTLPFDRHDWTVDRCGAEKVTYVIDFYAGAGSGSSTNGNAGGGAISFYLDVRPSVLSWTGIRDRLHMGWKRLWQ